MIQADYHTHTIFSPDGQETPEAMCEKALAIGLNAIAFTEHVEFFAPARTQPDFAAYFEAIARCRALFGPQGLQVLSGVEIGNAHDHLDEVFALLERYEFDVIITSLHWLSGQNIQRKQCFQGRDAADVYSAYFTELASMAAVSNVIAPAGRLVIGHFDRIFWPGILVTGRPDLTLLEPVIRETWEIVAHTSAALELNSRFLSASPNWRYELAVMLRWFHEAGGQRVVVNSDAHRTEHLGANFPLATELLQLAGIGRPLRLLEAPEPSLRVTRSWYQSGGLPV